VAAHDAQGVCDSAGDDGELGSARRESVLLSGGRRGDLRHGLGPGRDEDERYHRGGRAQQAVYQNFSPSGRFERLRGGGQAACIIA